VVLGETTNGSYLGKIRETPGRERDEREGGRELREGTLSPFGKMGEEVVGTNEIRGHVGRGGDVGPSKKEGTVGYNKNGKEGGESWGRMC